MSVLLGNPSFPQDVAGELHGLIRLPVWRHWLRGEEERKAAEETRYPPCMENTLQAHAATPTHSHPQTSTHAHTFTPTQTYTLHTPPHACTHTQTSTHVPHMLTCTHIHTHIHTVTHKHPPTHPLTHTHTCTLCSYPQTSTHTLTHTYSHLPHRRTHTSTPHFLSPNFQYQLYKTSITRANEYYLLFVCVYTRTVNWFKRLLPFLLVLCPVGSCDEENPYQVTNF
jgi:hypothetical protein